jgi:hypothetical protein
MGQKQLHVFLLVTFTSFHQRVDIMLTKDDIHTLANVVISDPTRVDLLPQSCVTLGFVVFDAT